LIEYAMLITLGACAASLAWLALWPALSRRTERLARRRIEAGLPMSVAEFAGERDQLRAALAVKEARIEKRAEALAVEQARMLAEAGELQARLALLEERLAEETRRHEETAAEQLRLTEGLAEASAALEAEQREHAAAGEKIAALEATYRELTVGQGAGGDAAEQRRLERSAFQAEREALRGRIEGLEATHQALRAEHSALARVYEGHHVENAALKAERETHLERLERLERSIGAREARLTELGELTMRREIEKTDAEVRASELATRLAANDVHAARLAADLEGARERLAALEALHQRVARQASEATVELEVARRELEAERGRGERAEAAERLHVARAEAELRELAQAFASARADLGAAVSSLDETRAERDRLKSQASTGTGGGAAENAAPEKLVAMIERLADDIARASGAGPLPAIADSSGASDEAHRAVAE
jgi:chromosome segregation ATPase